MNSTIIFLSILIIFLSIMLEINVSIKYDLLSNNLLVNIRIFKIRIVHIKFDVVGLFYEINNSKKIKKIKDIFSKENNYFFTQIKKSVLDKLYYGKVEIFSSIGLDNAKDTTMMVSIINNIFTILDEKLSKKDIEFNYYNKPIFIKSNFNIEAKIQVYFTIFDLLFSILFSLYKRGRYVRKNTKQRI